MSGLNRTVALVGMMGAGKSSVGRRLAARLNVPFRDADTEIETAAGCTINEIFERYGEPAFRDGERKVIARLLAEPPHVLATGGGAFIDDATRAEIKQTRRFDLAQSAARSSAGSRHAPRHAPAAEKWRPARNRGRGCWRSASRSMRRPISPSTAKKARTPCGRAHRRCIEGTWASSHDRTRHRRPRRRSYDIHVGAGLLAQAGALVAPLCARHRSGRHRQARRRASSANAFWRR